MDKFFNERINTLHPLVRDIFSNFLKECEDLENCDFRITQALRTIQEQDDLYAQGRTKEGKIVTNAKGGYSFHNFGLAIDIVPIKNNSIDWNYDFKKLKDISDKYNLTWGGTFPIKDLDHFEINFGKPISFFRQILEDGKIENNYIKINDLINSI